MTNVVRRNRKLPHFRTQTLSIWMALVVWTLRSAFWIMNNVISIFPVITLVSIFTLYQSDISFNVWWPRVNTGEYSWLRIFAPEHVICSLCTVPSYQTLFQICPKAASEMVVFPALTSRNMSFLTFWRNYLFLKFRIPEPLPGFLLTSEFSCTKCSHLDEECEKYLRNASTYILHDVHRMEAYQLSKRRLFLASFTSTALSLTFLELFTVNFSPVTQLHNLSHDVCSGRNYKTSRILCRLFRPCVNEFCCTLHWPGFLRRFGNTGSSLDRVLS